MKQTVRVGMVTAAIAAGIVLTLAAGAGRQAPVREGAFTTPYDQRVLDDPLEILLVQSDGQAFATLARDPLLARPEEFRTDAEASYRAARPLLPWLAWAGSLGRPDLVPPALALLAVLGTGLAGAGLARLLLDRGVSPWPAVLVAFLPGTYSALTYLGPEPLCLGLLAWGIWAWSTRPARPWLAAGLFTAAALTRETALLVPLALGLEALWRRRRGTPRRELHVAVLAVPFGALAAWFAVLHVRIGAWPTDAGQGRLTRPFAGLADAAGQWEVPREELVYLALTVLLVLGVLWRCRDDVLAWVVAVHVLFATTMGERVWVSWEYWGRVLLPLFALGFVAVVARALRRAPGAEPYVPSVVPSPRIHAQASST